VYEKFLKKIKLFKFALRESYSYYYYYHHHTHATIALIALIVVCINKKNLEFNFLIAGVFFMHY